MNDSVAGAAAQKNIPVLGKRDVGYKMAPLFPNTPHMPDPFSSVDWLTGD